MDATDNAVRPMRPVFIGGCPRSGTTLLGSMLGAHSQCLCIPESGFKLRALRLCSRNASARDIVEDIQSAWRFKLWGVDTPNLAPGRADSTAEEAFAEAFDAIVLAYGRHVQKPQCQLWVDHTPSNTRLGPALFRLFPNAKLVHIVRDGRAVAASVLPLDWGPNSVDEAARWWMEHVAVGLAAESWKVKGYVMRVRYEDLVLEPEATLHALSEFLEIDYEPAMAGAGGFKVPHYSNRQHALVGQRPNPSRVQSWKSELSCRQIEIFEARVGGMLEFLGYEAQFGVTARKLSQLERHLAGLYSIYRRRVSNRWRIRRRRRSIAGEAAPPNGHAEE